jgi:hypothetical protein
MDSIGSITTPRNLGILKKPLLPLFVGKKNQYAKHVGFAL